MDHLCSQSNSTFGADQSEMQVPPLSPRLQHIIEWLLQNRDHLPLEIAKKATNAIRVIYSSSHQGMLQRYRSIIEGFYKTYARDVLINQHKFQQASNYFPNRVQESMNFTSDQQKTSYNRMNINSQQGFNQFDMNQNYYSQSNPSLQYHNQMYMKDSSFGYGSAKKDVMNTATVSNSSVVNIGNTANTAGGNYGVQNNKMGGGGGGIYQDGSKSVDILANPRIQSTYGGNINYQNYHHHHHLLLMHHMDSNQLSGEQHFATNDSINKGYQNLVMCPLTHQNFQNYRNYFQKYGELENYEGMQTMSSASFDGANVANQSIFHNLYHQKSNSYGNNGGNMMVSTEGSSNFKPSSTMVVDGGNNSSSNNNNNNNSSRQQQSTSLIQNSKNSLTYNSSVYPVEMTNNEMNKCVIDNGMDEYIKYPDGQNIMGNNYYHGNNRGEISMKKSAIINGGMGIKRHQSLMINGNNIASYMRSKVDSIDYGTNTSMGHESNNSGSINPISAMITNRPLSLNGNGNFYIRKDSSGQYNNNDSNSDQYCNRYQHHHYHERIYGNEGGGGGSGGETYLTIKNYGNVMDKQQVCLSTRDDGGLVGTNFIGTKVGMMDGKAMNIKYDGCVSKFSCNRGDERMMNEKSIRICDAKSGNDILTMYRKWFREFGHLISRDDLNIKADLGLVSSSSSIGQQDCDVIAAFSRLYERYKDIGNNGIERGDGNRRDGELMNDGKKRMMDENESEMSHLNLSTMYWKENSFLARKITSILKEEMSKICNNKEAISSLMRIRRHCAQQYRGMMGQYQVVLSSLIPNFDHLFWWDISKRKLQDRHHYQVLSNDNDIYDDGMIESDVIYCKRFKVNVRNSVVEPLSSVFHENITLEVESIKWHVRELSKLDSFFEIIHIRNESIVVSKYGRGSGHLGDIDGYHRPTLSITLGKSEDDNFLQIDVSNSCLIPLRITFKCSNCPFQEILEWRIRQYKCEIMEKWGKKSQLANRHHESKTGNNGKNSEKRPKTPSSNSHLNRNTKSAYIIVNVLKFWKRILLSLECLEMELEVGKIEYSIFKNMHKAKNKEDSDYPVFFKVLGTEEVRRIDEEQEMIGLEFRVKGISKLYIVVPLHYPVEEIQIISLGGDDGSMLRKLVKLYSSSDNRTLKVLLNCWISLSN